MDQNSAGSVGTELDEFRSIHGHSRLTEVDLMIDFCRTDCWKIVLDQPATATDQGILIIEESLFSEYKGFLPPPCMCG